MYEELVKRLRETTVNHDEKCESCSYEEDYPCCVDCLDEMHIEAAHAIEELSKERKTGKWCADYDYVEYDFDGSTPLPEPRKFQDGWKCSLCGEYSPSETNFCPNCGADTRPELPKEE